MGTLLYGTPPSALEMSDRLLSHLKPVIVNKLRRGESFLLSWESSRDEGSGRWSLWMHPSIPLQFRFDGSRAPSLNRNWLDALALSAGSAEGLRVIAEPGVPSALADTKVVSRKAHKGER